MIIRGHYFRMLEGHGPYSHPLQKKFRPRHFDLRGLELKGSVRFESITLAKDIVQSSKFPGITIISYACSNHQQAYYKFIGRRFPPSDTITVYGNQIDVKLYGHG